MTKPKIPVIIFFAGPRALGSKQRLASSKQSAGRSMRERGARLAPEIAKGNEARSLEQAQRRSRPNGEMAERLMALVLKTSDAERHRGFESLSLRQFHTRQTSSWPWRCTQAAVRGSPAKGVGWDNRCESSNLSISAIFSIHFYNKCIEICISSAKEASFRKLSDAFFVFIKQVSNESVFNFQLLGLPAIFLSPFRNRDAVDQPHHRSPVEGLKVRIAAYQG